MGDTVSPMDVAALKRGLEREGFVDVGVHAFPPEMKFGVHTHPLASVHVMLAGDLTLISESETVHLTAGDRFDIEKGTTHDAIAGREGCSFIVGTKPI